LDNRFPTVKIYIFDCTLHVGEQKKKKRKKKKKEKKKKLPLLSLKNAAETTRMCNIVATNISLVLYNTLFQLLLDLFTVSRPLSDIV
jgi:hypothetical protein